MKKKRRVAVATSSRLAADAAAELAELGGNAVDCAVAASIVTMNTEPGVCALAGGAYVTVWPPAGEPLTIDGGVAVPGAELGDDYHPDEGTAVYMGYGGGVETVVGCASVGVPGALSACDRAASRFGACDWQQILEPSIRATRDGFPLPSAGHYYLEHGGATIYRRSAGGRAALFDDGRQLRPAGSSVVVPGLADSLAQIAKDGARALYQDELATRIVEHVRDGGGRLTAADLANYRPVERPALTTGLDHWTIAVNPPPAVGGAVLASLLLLTRQRLAGLEPGDEAVAEGIIAAQDAALDFRKSHLDFSDDVGRDAATMIELARSARLPGSRSSSATVHTSAVDDSGLACAITASAGYGSGEIPTGTGLWLNNCLGELELNKRGLEPGPPGTRLPSNMAPGVARNGKACLAFGSPGADRITTALQQFLLNHFLFGLDLDAANAAPRLHVEVGRKTMSVSAEPGLALGDPGCPVRTYPAANMYFGGVGAARFDGENQLDASADPRRVGGVFVSDKPADRPG